MSEKTNHRGTETQRSQSKALLFLTSLCLCASVVPCSSAADLRQFGDAPLHAIQFVDRLEGWACGADGVVWHSIDGGKCCPC